MNVRFSDEQVRQILYECEAGRKLEAVKLCKEWSGSSLLEAKRQVESLVANDGEGGETTDSDIDDQVMDEVLEAIQNGNKLQAVKLYKQCSGASLMESKKFIERLMRELGVDDPRRRGCAGILLAVIVPITICCMLGCGNQQPTKQPTVQHETEREKRETVVQNFTGNAQGATGDHAESLERFFDECSGKIGSGNSAEFREVFDSRMTLRLLKNQQMLPANLGNEDRLVDSMDAAMAERLADPVMGIAWEKHEIRGVQFIKDDVEAVIYVRHWDADDVASKMRWWLMRDGDHWRAYDFEVLELSMRFSVMMGFGFKMADKKDPSAKYLPELMSAIQRGIEGDESAMETLQDLEDVGFPPVMESLRLVMLAAGLTDAGDYEQGLALAERALAINSDMPAVYLIESACYNGLSRYDEALKSADIYAKFLGKDSEYFVETGNAFAGLREQEKALDAYRQGLADDSQAGDCVLGLLRIQSGDLVIEHYKALNDIDEWFPYFAETLLYEDDADHLQALLELHRSIRPDDKYLSYYEGALDEMKEAKEAK